MEHWYGMLWQHKNRHRDLLQEAARERRANAVQHRRRLVINSLAVSLFILWVAAILMILRFM